MLLSADLLYTYILTSVFLISIGYVYRSFNYIYDFVANMYGYVFLDDWVLLNPQVYFVFSFAGFLTFNMG